MGKLILGIETSCDETAAAIVLGEGKRVQLLSNIVASSADLQAKYGGVIPEQAAREQLKSIIPVITEALTQAFPGYKPSTKNPPPIDAIAVTQGPGLIGSLLVGVETAKTLSLVWGKPLIPINHLIAHFYANWLDQISDVRYQMSDSSTPTFPLIGLLVSGGHTDLILMKDHGVFDYLGGTRDDAAGEAFDKTARILGLPYPGGPQIAKLAEKGDPKAYNLPRPMISSGDFDFSFSGLKTAVANTVHSSQFMVHGENGEPITSHELTANLAASVQAAIVDVLVTKTIIAAQKYNIEQILVAGGVAANQRLCQQMKERAEREIPGIKVFIPHPSLCTDNGATVATAAYFNFHPEDPLSVQANPNLSLSP